MTNTQLDENLVRELMTLAGLAYGDPQKLDGYLAGSQTAAWRVVWAAAAELVPDTFAFIARDGESSRYAIVIRGTYPHPLNIAYWNDATLDSPYGPMQPWPGDATGKAKIAKGTSKAFGDILKLQDSAGKSFADAAGALPPGADIYITGHSLGGTLAPVVGLWLSERPVPVTPIVCAFAGMTPGNAAFAALFGPGTRLDGRVWRYNNTLDTVPYGWDRVWSAIGFYKPRPSSFLVKVAIGFMGLILSFYGFRAIGTEVPLKGTVNAPVFKSNLVSYVIENLRQHLPETYLALLGAAPLPFTIGFGAIVADGAHPAMAATWSQRPRAFFV